MRHLPTILREVLDPRKVLFAAALVAAAGVLAGYVEVQDRADRELALRQGPPPPVLIQDFRPGRDIGAANEVLLYGEIDMSVAVTVADRGSDPQSWSLIVPVLPVSDMGAARLSEGAAPAGEVLVAQLERRSTNGVPNRGAVGLVVVPLAGPGVAPRAAEELAEAVLGEGDHGALVRINGEAVSAGDLELVAHGAFAVMDLTLADRYVAVAPFLEGRVAALGAPRPSPERRLLFIAALVLLAMAGGLQVLRFLSPVPAEGSDEVADYTPPPPSRHPEFAPIPSQREIQTADRVAAEMAVGPNPTVEVLKTLAQGLWAMLWLAGAALLRRAREFRNRRSPREDEAL